VFLLIRAAFDRLNLCDKPADVVLEGGVPAARDPLLMEGVSGRVTAPGSQIFLARPCRTASSTATGPPTADLDRGRRRRVPRRVFPIRQVADLTNIGILSAFVVVCGRHLLPLHVPRCPRSFRLPLMPVVPAFGVLASLFLILQLQWQTWARFLVWLVIGLVITSLTDVSIPCSAPDSPLHARTPASGTQR
jgi:C-terminus of AA_permease